MNTPETTAERMLEITDEHASVAVCHSHDGKTTCDEIPVADLQTLAREYLRGRWIPVSERLPGTNGPYEVTAHAWDSPGLAFTDINTLTDCTWEMTSRGYRVIAWRERPSPYQPPDPFAEGCPTCGCLPGEDHDVERECGTKSESCVDCLGIGCPSCGM